MDKASYLPNLCFSLKLKVLDADEVFASNDLGCANFEIRHFIDRNYLASIAGGQEYLDTIVNPTPPCGGLWGTKRRSGDETVVGMLSTRLKVSIYRGSKSGWVLAKLQNVLVIDELPVPIHISLKSLELYPDSDVQSGVRFTKSIFPPSFQRHPYWNEGRNVLYVGSYGHMNARENATLTRNIIEGRSGRADTIKTGRVCLTCGKGCTMTCSRCQDAPYCSKTCQKKDWPRHKMTCA